jgi:SAM-dependent methyltransferase
MSAAAHGTRAPTRLTDAASAYYRSAGHFAWYFARGKLRGDPVYAAVLARDLLGGRHRIVDLGCGQGLLAAWLLAAHQYYARDGRDARPAGAWPRGWPAPPLLASYRGIEINAREVARARHAFALATGAAIEIVHGDIRDVDYGTAEAVVMLDVLHYLDAAAQERVLERARRALAPRGLLLLRVGDAAAGVRSTLSQALDRTVVLARRGRWLPLECRALSDWQALLTRCGFRGHEQAVSAGTPFANWLLRAELA